MSALLQGSVALLRCPDLDERLVDKHLPEALATALLLRRGFGIAPALLGGALLAIAGYLLLLTLGRRFGWPV